MASRTSEPSTRKIYGATSQIQVWQHSKSPVLVAVRPVQLDSFTYNNNRQFRANVQAGSKLVGVRPSSLKNDFTNFASRTTNDRADGYGQFDSTGTATATVRPDGRVSKDFSRSKSLSGVHNSNYNDYIANEADGNIDFAKYDQTKLLELSTIDLVEQSALAAERDDPELALIKAKEALEILNLLGNLLPQEPPAAKQGANKSISKSQLMTTGARMFELSLMVNSNLAEQLQNNGCLDESMEMYVQLYKLASSSGGSSLYSDDAPSRQHDFKFLLHRFGLNIGNILYQMGDHQRALKYYRLTLDRLSSTGYKNLKIKLMNNIAITLMSKADQDGQPVSRDCLISMSVLLADNLTQRSTEPNQRESKLSVCNSNHHKFGLNLLTCQYLLGDSTSMIDTIRSLVRADICHHYRRILEFSTKISNEVGSSKSLASRGVDRKQTQLNRTGRSSTSSHAPVSTSERVSRLARKASVNQREDQVLGCLADEKQRTTSALSALNNEDDIHFTRSKLIAHNQMKIERDQDERPRTSLTTLSEFGHNRADFQRVRERREMLTTPMIGPDMKRTKIQVLLSTERDRLEMMICKQHKLSSRALIIGCNLMMDLEHKSNEHRPTDRISAFDFCSHLLSTSELYGHLVNDLKMNNAVKMLLSGDHNQIQAALAMFKDIEDKISQATDSKMGLSSMIETNLSLLNILRDDYKKAAEHADSATKIDESNPDGLVNLANCFFLEGDLKAAQSIYHEALALRFNCRQGNYNLAIVTRKLGLELYDLDEFIHQQLESRKSDSNIQIGLKELALPAVQSALLQRYSNEVDRDVPSKLSSLISRSNQGPELSLMASEMAQSDDEATKILRRANSEHPHSLPTLERLVAFSIKAFNYQSAMRLLVDCIRIRPDQPRWYQILAECCRRAAKYDQAIAIYKIAANLFPQDSGCLRALIKITEELGLKSDNELYQVRLDKLEGAIRRPNVGNRLE